MTTTTGDTATALAIDANIHVGLDLLTMGTAHGLPAPFTLDASQDRVVLQFWSHLDVARWASYVGVDVRHRRTGDYGHRLHAHAEGRWQDRPIRLASSQHIVYLTDTSCPQCEGSGEVGTGLREHDTGAWKTTPCGLCEATGVLAVRA